MKRLCSLIFPWRPIAELSVHSCSTRWVKPGTLWGYSAVQLVWHGWAWPTCATPTTLPCKSNASCCCPTRATRFIRDTLVCAPSNVSSFVLTAFSNEYRELLHTTPETSTWTPEAATPATLVLEGYSCRLTGTTLPLILGVRQRFSRCRNWHVWHESHCRMPSMRHAQRTTLRCDVTC